VRGLGDIELNLISNVDDILRFKEWLGRRREIDAIGFDTETDGFDRYNGKVRLIQFGDDTAGWAMDRDDWQGLARWVFANFEGDFIGHNAPFDVDFLENSCKISVPRHRVHDTLVRSAILESHMSKALKNQATRHVDPAAAGLQDVLKGTNFTWGTVPTAYGPYWQYGALDPVLTYCLELHHRPLIEREAPDAYELEMAVLWVVSKMSRNGAFIDRPFAQRYLTEFTDYCDQVDTWCQTEYGVKPGSNAAIVAILQEAGHVFSKATASGAVALDKEVLEGIDHPLAVAVLNRRRAQKMASTYLTHYVNEADARSLIHPTFNTLGARTGRMSCSEPNLQNLPRLGTTTFGDVVRNCVKTRHSTMWDPDVQALQNLHKHGGLVFCDFDQIEMRVLAHMAQEQAMIDAFKGPNDFFVELAQQVFQDPTITKKDKRRQIVKNAGYAKIYFAGLAKFAQTAGIPQSQAREFLTRFDALYSNVPKFMQSVLDTAMQRRLSEGIAYARSPLTNRRHVADHRKEYALINHLIQGMAAELNKMKLIELDAVGLGDYMIATIHDEVMLDLPADQVAEVIPTVKKIMNDDKLLSVPITAGISFGERWGKKFDYEETA
jgi:DNA polymerase I